MKAIDVPEKARELTLIVSLSGGKDSTATALALREAGLPFRMAFADTGWEAPETYAHLEVLERHLGPIARVGAPGGMVAKVRARAGFPARMQRWCTRELKIDPLRAYHDQIEAETGEETACVVGVRAEESRARRGLAAWEDDHEWGGWMWRPIIAWVVQDVLEIHRRHGVPLNPLYHRGHSRVGCWPCIFAQKEEIRLIADADPGRIEEIRALERYGTLQRSERNAETPGRYAHAESTMFQTVNRESPGAMDIDQIVAWSRTVRGGGASSLFSPHRPLAGAFAGACASRRRCRSVPVDWSRYPPNWKALVAQVRERSGDRCECRGECGRPECAASPCLAANRQPHPISGSKVVLTTAHLDHDTERNELSNLRHLCQKCHLYLDRHQHAKNATATTRARRARERAEAGQQDLFSEGK